MRKTFLMILGLLFLITGAVSSAGAGEEGLDVVDPYTGIVIHHQSRSRKSSGKTLKDPQTGIEVNHSEIQTYETNGEWTDPQTGQTIRERAISR